MPYMITRKDMLKSFAAKSLPFVALTSSITSDLVVLANDFFFFFPPFDNTHTRMPYPPRRDYFLLLFSFVFFCSISAILSGLHLVPHDYSTEKCNVILTLFLVRTYFCPMP